jgi:hypothetical protein
MGKATIKLQEQTIQIQTVPGSGFIKVFLPETDDCFYNPASELFSTAPFSDGATQVLVAHQLPALKQKLNEFDANRRADIARHNKFSAAL